jgi:hypothetical protein
MPKAKPKQADSPLVPVRLLIDTPHGLAGAYAEVPAESVESMKAAGEADDSEAAVAYAREQLSIAKDQ